LECLSFFSAMVADSRTEPLPAFSTAAQPVSMQTGWFDRKPKAS
jgi:hypothetical protein